MDCAVINERRFEELIETKYADENISKQLVYYADRRKPEKGPQVVAKLKRPYDQGNIKVIDSIDYFGNPL